MPANFAKSPLFYRGRKTSWSNCSVKKTSYQDVDGLKKCYTQSKTTLRPRSAGEFESDKVKKDQSRSLSADRLHQSNSTVLNQNTDCIHEQIKCQSADKLNQVLSTPRFMRRKKGRKIFPVSPGLSDTSDSLVSPNGTSDISLNSTNESTFVGACERRLNNTSTPRRKKQIYRQLSNIQIRRPKQLFRKFSDDDECYKKRSVKVKHSNENAVWYLRRRASSLDFLPEALATAQHVCQQASTGGKTSPFNRTTSMSQRSPFRKKLVFTDSDAAMAGLREGRPKGAKRIKSGVEALFDSIERQDIEEVRKLVQTLDFNINELNGDEFTPLDIALMSGENEIASLLIKQGGVENPKFADPDVRRKHIESQILAAENNVNDLTDSVVNSGGDVKDNEKQLREWEWKLYMLKIIQTGFTSADKPCEAPTMSLAPLSDHSVVVTLTDLQSHENENKNIITKFKIEWSRCEDFTDIEGSKIVTDRRHSITIKGLEKNVMWFFRGQSGNIKGFSPYGYPEPKAVMPSCWHECNNSVPRYHGASDQLGKIITQLYAFQRQQSEANEAEEENDDTANISQDIPRPLKQRHNGGRKMKKSLSKYTHLIFSSAPKLLKKMKSRGIYLAALLYSEDESRVLVTMDDNLPIVECDENYSKSFSQEFYWFSKTACTWEDIHHMLEFSTKSQSSHSVQIRRKLLESALLLMNATGVDDLGRLYYKPFRDNHGSMLLLAVNCVEKQSLSKATTMKWLPIYKLMKKTTQEQLTMPEKLIPSIQDHVTYHRRSRTHLPSGLYLGYLKLRSSLGSLSIVVPKTHTNVLPFVKIQDVPNVTKDEWLWLKNNNSSFQNTDDCCCQVPSSFAKRLRHSASKLFEQLSISPEDAAKHRLYDHEVIELNPHVLFILICPPTDEICTAPNQTDKFTDNDGFSELPVQAFEISNMMTYQPDVMSSYSRLSSILELETYSTQHELRETISETNTELLKQKLNKIYEFQNSVDEHWRSTRWVVDTLQQCQDRNLNVGIQWSNLLTRIEILETCITDKNSTSPRCSTSASETDSCDTSEPEISIKQKRESIKVHGTDEIGLSELSCAEVPINHQTTTLDIIQTAAQHFQKTCIDMTSCDVTSEVCNDTAKCNSDVLCDFEKLGLVVVSGSREKCLSDDLNICDLQDPWENGTMYLRLKKEALRATKWGISTSV